MTSKKAKEGCTPCPDIAKWQQLEAIYGTDLSNHTETRIVDGKRKENRLKVCGMRMVGSV